MAPSRRPRAADAGELRCHRRAGGGDAWLRRDRRRWQGRVLWMRAPMDRDGGSAPGDVAGCLRVCLGSSVVIGAVAPSGPRRRRGAGARPAAVRWSDRPPPRRWCCATLDKMASDGDLAGVEQGLAARRPQRQRGSGRAAQGFRGQMYSPLYLAANTGHAAVVQKRRDAQADVAWAKSNGYTALQTAVNNGHTAVVLSRPAHELTRPTTLRQHRG
jgi:hypothetical protein